MSLIPYQEGSVVLSDPSSRSLVIVNPSSGSLEFFRRVSNTGIEGREPSGDLKQRRISIASYVCPQCGTEIHPRLPLDDQEGQDSGNGNSSRGMNLSRKYFHLLEDNHKANDQDGSLLPPPHQSFIPPELFIPGYFRKFFQVLSLLGSGARGSVFKVVHKIGDIQLGVFALKKIPIGNDMAWFQKCIREVKALSSLTHLSANLITYNHVWLEMDTACGLVRTLDGKQSDTVENIPCIFILQQYCSGGNLEDFILKDVFHKFPDFQSPEERKRLFKYCRTHNDNHLGLSTEQIVHIMRDIARGIHELHDIGIIHRDLKPSNCLLLNKYPGGTPLEEFYPTVVIGDLGECQKDGESRTATGATGTLEFTAPELIIMASNKHADYNEYSFASDIYSLGMICYFVVFGQLPFEPQMEMKDLKQRIMSCQFEKESLLKKHLSLGLKPIDTRIFDLMEMLLCRNMNHRPCAKEVELFLDELWLGLDLEVLAKDLESENEEHVEDDSNHSFHSVSESKFADPDSQQQSTIPWKKVLCICINMIVAVSITYQSPGRSILAYSSLVLLGISIQTSLGNQKWILTTIALAKALGSPSTMHLLTF